MKRRLSTITDKECIQVAKIAMPHLFISGNYWSVLDADTDIFEEGGRVVKSKSNDFEIVFDFGQNTIFTWNTYKEYQEYPMGIKSSFKAVKYLNEQNIYFDFQLPKHSVLVEFKLKKIREFQEQHPESHIGGSFGLMLRGIDLRRGLDESDADIVCKHEVKTTGEVNVFTPSDESDFDQVVVIKEVGTAFYLKIDISIGSAQSFDKVEYDGHMYNVSKLDKILEYKQKYADKGYAKHIDDLIAIRTGVRPEIPTENKVNSDDSPF